VGANGRCTTLISSEGYVSTEYAGRANLTNFPENGQFVVNIAKLTQDDSGNYKCGLGINSRGLSFDVSLEVSQGKGPRSLGFWGKSEKIISAVMGRLEKEFLTGSVSWHGVQRRLPPEAKTFSNRTQH
jgi:hypothetical protein